MKNPTERVIPMNDGKGTVSVGSGTLPTGACVYCGKICETKNGACAECMGTPTVISNGFRSDVRAVRNAVSHSIFERKGEGYRLHDDPGKYSREFTVEELHTFAVRCLEKSAIVLDMVMAMMSMTLYHLLVTAYRGAE